MSITRRQFLLGTAAGLVLPSFYEKAFSYFENHGEPLLITPKRPGEILYACSEFTVEDWWIMQDSPYARAYHYLEGIDLGPELSGAGVAGGLDFYCDGAPGNSYLAVDAVDDVSLSLLQQRLNELGSGIKVELR